jgi:hypothetical protein
MSELLAGRRRGSSTVAMVGRVPAAAFVLAVSMLLVQSEVLPPFLGQTNATMSNVIRARMARVSASAFQ